MASQPFTNTLRSLETDGSRTWIVLLTISFIFVLAWIAWFRFAPISLYESSQSARLEVASAAHAIEPEVAGRIARTVLRVGARVSAGDPLVLLDASDVHAEIAAVHSNLTTLRRRMAAITVERAELLIASGARGQADLAAVKEARARVTAGVARTEMAERAAARAGALKSEQLISAAEAERAMGEARAVAAAEQALQMSAERIDRERVVQESERRLRLAALDHLLIEMEGDTAQAAARLARLQIELRRREVRAPTGGRIGDVVPFDIGAVVAPGQRLGSIIPDERVRVLAYFPASALGRIKRGQRALLRPHGFDWTRFGVLRARVATVARETSHDSLRVELDVANRAGRIPIEHGITGAVEVEVERTTPWQLVLRRAGRILMSSRPQAGTVG